MSQLSSKLLDRLSIRTKPKVVDGDSELLLARQSTPIALDIFESKARSVETIITSTQYRLWLTEQAERWRPFESESRDYIKGRRQFFIYAKQCIANSAMNPRERSLALTALQETERSFSR